MRKILCSLFCILALLPQIFAEDSPLARQMAAEIVEQAANSNTAYATVLRDVGKALRKQEMSVSDAKDLLSLAASCQQLGANPQSTRAAAKQFDHLIGADTSKSAHANEAGPAAPLADEPVKVDRRPAPELLDIDKLLDEEVAVNQGTRSSLFKGLDGEKQAGNNASAGYSGGTAGRALPWNSDSELARAKAETTSEQDRSELTAKTALAVDEKTLRKASSRVRGSVTMVMPTPDRQNSIVLIDIGSKSGLKDKQEILIIREGQALVKAVINRVKDYEAFALVSTDTWAVSSLHEVKIGDSVAGL